MRGWPRDLGRPRDQEPAPAEGAHGAHGRGRRNRGGPDRGAALDHERRQADGRRADPRGAVGQSDSSLLFGYVPGEFPERRLVIVSGRRPRGNEALVGDGAARIYHLRVGGPVRAGKRSFRVAGIFHSGNPFVDRGVVLPLRVVQSIAQRPHEVTTLAVIAKLGATPKAVAKRLESRFPGITAVVEPGQAVKVDTSSRLIVTAGWIFSLLALIIGGIGVTNTMAMAVFERVREIGIMRAVGWTSRRIAGLIVCESLGIGLIALGLGLLG